MRYFRHVMGAHQSLEKDIMLGITGGARKKGKPHMWWMEDIKSVNVLPENNKSVSERQEKVALIRERSQEEKPEQCLFQGKGNDKPEKNVNRIISRK